MKTKNIVRWRALTAMIAFIAATLTGAMLPVADASAALVTSQLPTPPPISTSVLDNSIDEARFGVVGNILGIRLSFIIPPETDPDTEYLVYIRERGTNTWLEAIYSHEGGELKAGTDYSIKPGDGIPVFIHGYYDGPTSTWLENDQDYDVGVTIRGEGYGMRVQTITLTELFTGNDLYADAPTLTGILNDRESGSLVVSWEEPAYVGHGMGITGYRITVVGAGSSETRTFGANVFEGDITNLMEFVDGQTYSLSVVALNGPDGFGTNIVYSQFMYHHEVQAGESVGAPDTGFTLNLANPLTVAALGISTTATLLGFALYLRKQR